MLKSRIGLFRTRQTLTPIGLARVFQRSTQAVDSPLAAKMYSERGCPEVTYSTGSAHSAKNDVERLTCVWKNPLQFPIDSREGSIFSEPQDPHSPIAQRTSAVGFFGKLPVDRPVLVANVRFCSFNPSGPSLIQFRGQCCFFLYAQTGKVQEVTDLRKLPILRCLRLE